MAMFIETFDVIEGDGQWTYGPQPMDTLSPGFAIGNYDICNPATPPAPPDFEMGQNVSPFAIKAYIQAPTRCAPEDLMSFVADAMQESAEYSITDALWNGAISNPTSIYLKHSSVTSVPRSGNDYALLGKALKLAYKQTPFIKPVIHLGFQTAMSLHLGLQNLGLPFVVSPGYPQDAIAVSGPVRVRLGSIGITKQVNPADNRLQVEATRLARIEFNPFMAVRVADSAGS